LCPRKYQYQYVDGYEPVETSKDLRMGSAWSVFLEAGSVPSDAPLSTRDLAVLEILAEGYRKLYWPEDVEREVALVYKNVRGSLDGLGDSFLIESKLTRSRVDWEYWEKISFNQQVMLYMFLAKMNGYSVDRVVYDVTRRPMQRPRKTENEQKFLARVADEVYERRHEYFQRRTYYYTDEELEHNFENMQRIVGSMPVPGDYYPEHRNSCGAFGKLCEFFEVCTGTEELTNEELYAVRKR
jgi:hypothetical protein